jgi:hypothetical protein
MINIVKPEIKFANNKIINLEYCPCKQFSKEANNVSIFYLFNIYKYDKH